MSKALRVLPAVDKVLQALQPLAVPRQLAVRVIRRELARLRVETSLASRSDATEARSGSRGADAVWNEVLTRVRAALVRRGRARLQPVINGTGVIIHTNLGRAPLGPAAVAALGRVAENYSSLELDLESGERGGRAACVEENLAVLADAEAATVVNNCAAALVLMLRHFTAGARKEVVISRGELIQIGGGFRIPEILEASGAVLREVGTTNQTSLDDYARGLGAGTALILKVHRSNFHMAGFVASPTTEVLATLARERRIPLVEDLGSGALVTTEDWGLGTHEPTLAQAVAQGVDLVCCSGDKLLGGPQAGIIAGKARLISALKRAPLFRALRCDKLVLAALEATTESYLHALSNGPETVTLGRTIPVLAMLAIPMSHLRERAARLVSALADLPVETVVSQTQGRLGGGALPQSGVESIAVGLRPSTFTVAALATRLRKGSPPVIGHLGGGWLRIDLRTVFESQDTTLAACLRAALGADPP